MEKAKGKRKAENQDEGVQKLPRHGEKEKKSIPGPNWKAAVPQLMRAVDSDGRFVYKLGEDLTPRYQIISKLGEGTYSQVLECWDRQGQEYVAIKVSRSTRNISATTNEVLILQSLAMTDEARSRCVKIHHSFQHEIHLCIVFEKLGPSLRDFLKTNHLYPCPVDLVREFGRQLLQSVACVHCNEIVHTDLKPENILLVSADYVKLKKFERILPDGTRFMYHLPKPTVIKLIDFGSSIYSGSSLSHLQHHSSRNYRAPEIILGSSWSYPCDLWSVGCILAELCTGQQLFKTEEDLERLAMMERALGLIPVHMITRATREAEKYFRGLRLNWPEGASSTDSIGAVNSICTLEELVSPHVQDSERRLLIDLLNCLLRYDPSKRLNAQQALEHPFLKKSYWELDQEGNLVISHAEKQ